jgi:hypothetical protein
MPATQVLYHLNHFTGPSYYILYLAFFDLGKQPCGRDMYINRLMKICVNSRKELYME